MRTIPYHPIALQHTHHPNHNTHHNHPSYPQNAGSTPFLTPRLRLHIIFKLANDITPRPILTRYKPARRIALTTRRSAVAGLCRTADGSGVFPDELGEMSCFFAGRGISTE
jgi:hypothetical protein